MSGASISGAVFGSLQNGVSRVRCLRPFASVLNKPRPDTLDEPALKGLQLIGWYCVRQTCQTGLSKDDVEFHCAYFPGPTDIALILCRAEREGYQAELYTRSNAGVFSRNEHRSSSFSLPSDPLLINKSLHIAVQSAIADSSYLRSYEITSTLERQDYWQEWKSRIADFCNPNWLRALPRSSGIKRSYSILGVSNLAVETTQKAFFLKTAPGDRSELPIRTTESSGDTAVVGTDAHLNGARDVSQNQKIEDARASKLDYATTLSNDADSLRMQAGDGQQKPSTTPLSDEYKEGRDGSTIVGAESSNNYRSILSNLKARFISWGRFRKLRIISPVLAVIVLIVLAGMLIANLMRHRPQNPMANDEASQATTIGLEPVRSDPGWELHWDAGSPSLRAAKAGVLTITDGSHVRKLELDRSQLLIGRVRYVPETQDVNFRLQIYTQNNRGLSESVRILGNTFSGPSGSTADIAHEIRPAGTSTLPNRNSVSNLHSPSFVKPDSDANLKSSVRGSGNQQSHAIGANRDELPPLSRTPLSGGTPDARLTRSKPVAKLAVESVPRQPQKASIAAKSIARSSAAVLTDPSVMPSYIGPQPLQKPAPNVTSLSAEIGSIRQVEIQVYIDDSGRVTNARVVNADHNASSVLEKAAISAALQWTFEPARLHSHPTSSTHKILFRFNRPHESAR